jgi:hypothetical protein
MVLADQDRLGTAPDPTGLPLDSVADGHHVEAGAGVVACAWGGGAVLGAGVARDHAKRPTADDQSGRWCRG